MPAVSYCLGTLLRNEIEDGEAGKLEAATDNAASVIAARHGSGEVAAKIQAHVIVAASSACSLGFGYSVPALREIPLLRSTGAASVPSGHAPNL